MIKIDQSIINNIVKDVPYPPGVGKTALKIAREELIKKITKEIIGREIKKTKLDKFKEILIDNIYSSFVEIYKPIGIEAATSISHPATQMTLDTHRAIGANSGISTSFEYIKSILTSSKVTKNPTMWIPFTDGKEYNDIHDTVHKGEFQDILNMKHIYEQISIDDLMVEYTVHEDLADLDDQLELFKDIFDRKFTFGQYSTNVVLRLELDTFIMYSHKITMFDLANAIEGVGSDRDVRCVWYSQFDGYMYILPNEKNDYGQDSISEIDAIKNMFQVIVLPAFKSIIVSGIPGIDSAEPYKVNILSGIVRGDNTNIYLNEYNTRWNFISLADVVRVLKLLKYKVGKIDKDNLSIEIKGIEGNRLTHIRNNISSLNREESELRDNAEEMRKKGKNIKNILKKADNIKKRLESFNYYLIKTRGININEVLWLDNVDTLRLRYNNSYFVQNNLGIEATRLYLILLLYSELINFGQRVDPRHIEIIFSTLTNLGKLNGLSFTGANRYTVGPIRAATRDRSFHTLANNSIFGAKEDVIDVTTSVATGQLSRMGTGGYTIENDIGPEIEQRPSFPTSSSITMLDTAISKLMKSELGKLGNIKKVRTEPVLEIKSSGLKEIEKLYPPINKGGALLGVKFKPTPNFPFTNNTLLNTLVKSTGFKLNKESKPKVHNVINVVPRYSPVFAKNVLTKSKRAPRKIETIDLSKLEENLL